MVLLTRLFHHVSEVVYVSEQRDEVLRYSKNVEGMSSVGTIRPLSMVKDKGTKKRISFLSKSDYFRLLLEAEFKNKTVRILCVTILSHSLVNEANNERDIQHLEMKIAVILIHHRSPR